MKKISIASIPTIFDPGLYSKEDSESTVVCKGQTAKLHSRNGGFQDEKQVSARIMGNEFIYITVDSTDRQFDLRSYGK